LLEDSGRMDRDITRTQSLICVTSYYSSVCRVWS